MLNKPSSGYRATRHTQPVTSALAALTLALSIQLAHAAGDQNLGTVVDTEGEISQQLRNQSADIPGSNWRLAEYALPVKVSSTDLLYRRSLSHTAGDGVDRVSHFSLNIIDEIDVFDSRPGSEFQRAFWSHTQSLSGGHWHAFGEFTDDEQRWDSGFTLGRATLLLHNGRGNSVSLLSKNFEFLDQHFFHGGVDLDFRTRGGTLGWQLNSGLALESGRYYVEANGVERRSTSMFGLRSARWHGQLLHVERSNDSVAYGVDFGWRHGRFATRFQSVINRTDAHSSLLRFDYSTRGGNVLGLSLQARANPLYGYDDDNRVMFSFAGRIGGRTSEIFQANDADSAESQNNRSRKLILAGVGAGAAVAIAGSSGSSGNDNARRFPTQNGAAFDVLNRINPNSVRENREYGGWVYRRANGTYSHTNPVRGTNASVNLGPSLNQIPAGLRRTATYHTHAASDPLYDNENFSPQDIRSDAFFGVDGYLATPAGRFLFHDFSRGRIFSLGRIAN